MHLRGQDQLVLLGDAQPVDAAAVIDFHFTRLREQLLRIEPDGGTRFGT